MGKYPDTENVKIIPSPDEVRVRKARNQSSRSWYASGKSDNELFTNITNPYVAGRGRRQYQFRKEDK